MKKKQVQNQPPPSSSAPAVSAGSKVKQNSNGKVTKLEPTAAGAAPNGNGTVSKNGNAVAINDTSPTTAVKITPSPSGGPTMETSISLTLTYIVIWCLHLCQPVVETFVFGPGHGALDSRPLVGLDYYILLPMVLLILTVWMTMIVTGRRRQLLLGCILDLSVVAHMIDIAIRLDRMPAVWDHEYWATCVNVSFLVSFLFGPSPLSGLSSTWLVGRVSDETNHVRWRSSQDRFVSLGRVQLGILYLAATFWKINTSFMDHTTSCGTVLIVELIGTYIGPIPPNVVQVLAKTAPSMTLVVEAILGIGFLWAGLGRPSSPNTTSARHVTLLKGAVFHILIFMMPVNAAGGFSLDCMTRLLILLESSEIDTLLGSPSSASQSPNRTAKVVARTVAIAFALSWVRHVATDLTAPLWDVGFTCSILLGAFYCQAVIASSLSKSCVEGNDGNATKKEASASPSTPAKSDTAQAAPSPLATFHPTPALTVNITSVIILVGTFLHAYVFTILGIQQMGAPTMYSNLRSYRGGNHYLVPTAVLGEPLLYGGGLVRVVDSNSTSVNLLLGYTKSHDVFPQRIVRYLESTIREPYQVETSSDVSTTTALQPLGKMPLQFFPMCMFNPHSRNVLMEGYQMSNPTGSPLFAPFIMPLSAVRNALQEGRFDGESFMVRMVYPAYDVDDDDSARQKVIMMDHTGTCQVHEGMQGTKTSSSIPCADDEVGKLLLIPKNQRSLWQRFLDKILTPYPELVGFEEEICMA